MKTIAMVITALAGCVALAGCGTRAVRPRAAPQPGQTYVISANCPTIAPVAATPYTITLGNSFDLRHATVGKGGHPPGTHGGSHKHPTALDLMTQVDATQSGTIRIELADGSLHFQDGGLALMGSTPESQDLFCGLTFDKSNGTDPRWLSFVVHAGTTSSAGYDLGLLADQTGSSAPQLPVIIDPWVDNNGIITKGDNS